MGAPNYNDFRDLEAWQRCREIRKKVWTLTKKFPIEEKYRLSDQMIRSSRSTTNCITEGYGRYHYQENIQFWRQSRGSLHELIDHLLVADECEYISNGEGDESIDEVKAAIAVLNGYIKYLKRQKDSNS